MAKGFFANLFALSTAGLSLPITNAIQRSEEKKANAVQPVAPLPLPTPPDTSAITETATKAIQQRRAAMTPSIYTSPLGIGGTADVSRKTLLGQ